MGKKTFAVLLGPLLGLLFFTVYFLDAGRWSAEAEKPIPFKSFKETGTAPLITAALGFRALTADFMWMDVIQFLGDREVPAETLKAHFYPKLKDVTAMDEHFTAAYIIGVPVLKWELLMQEEAVSFIGYGIEKNPKYGQLQLYLAALTYAKLNQFSSMVSKLESALALESHPPMLERILANIYAKLVDDETNPAQKNIWLQKGGRLWAKMYEESQDEQSMKLAAKHLKKYMNIEFK